MKTHSIQQLIRFIGSRTGRNIIFWFLLFLLKLTDLEDQFAYSNIFYAGIMLLLMLFFIGLTYFNNFFLVPRLLAKKRWLLYILATLPFTYAVAFCYTTVLKLLPVYFPGISPMDLSIITNPVQPGLSLAEIFEESYSFFSIMVIWVFIFTLLWYANESVEKVKRMQEIINKHRDTELQFLKNQLNPHFLFNTLNNLYALSLKKSDETPEAILKLSSILRYMLYESDANLVSFEKEKEIMQAYIDVELLRIPDSALINFSIMAEKAAMIPPLLWLPILENVFKHSRSAEEAEIDFRFRITGNTLNIYAKNNTTKAAVAPVKNGGIGLSNMRQRLALLFPEKHRIIQKMEENYFIIEVKIDLS
jgi:hypothetical protein